MSIFDAIESLAGGPTGGEDHVAVAGGLMRELGGASGVEGLIQSFQQNGAGNLIRQFASGQTGAIDPNAIEQALGSTGLIDCIAQRTGVSTDTVKSSLGTIVPLLVNHVTANGHITTDGQPGQSRMPEAGSLLQSVLARL